MSNAVQLLEQAEGLLNRGEIAVALGLIGMAKKEAGEVTGESKDTLTERIDAQRDAIFGAQALISVTIDSIDSEKDFARHHVLRDVHERLENIATELDRIEIDLRRAVHTVSDALLVSL